MSPPTSYHHGDLPAALRAATAELVAEVGPNGFSLREVARRAGVSHAAPAHHFGDSRGLLTSVAIEGFELLERSFIEALDGVTDPAERLNACGKAYVSNAFEYPGHFGVMAAAGLVDDDDPAFLTASASAYLQLVGVVMEIRDAVNPDLDVESAATMAWSSVHGLALLAAPIAKMAQVTESKRPSLDEIVDSFTKMMISGFAAR